MTQVCHYIRFRFRPDTTDADRRRFLDSLLGKYTLTGAAGAENSAYSVEPSGHFSVIAYSAKESEQIAEYLRQSPNVEAVSIRARDQDASGSKEAATPPGEQRRETDPGRG